MQKCNKEVSFGDLLVAVNNMAIQSHPYTEKAWRDLTHKEQGPLYQRF